MTTAWRGSKVTKRHGSKAAIPPDTGSVAAGQQGNQAAMRACIEEREDRMAVIAGQLREANKSFVESLTRIGVSGAALPSDNGSHPASAAHNNLQLLESKTAEQILQEASESIERQRRYLESMKEGEVVQVAEVKGLKGVEDGQA